MDKATIKNPRLAATKAGNAIATQIHPRALLCIIAWHGRKFKTQIAKGSETIMPKK